MLNLKISITFLIIFLTYNSTVIIANESIKNVDTEIGYVISRGLWKDKNSYGSYRIIVQNQGWEHVRSFFYLQWLKTEDSNKRVIIYKTRPIKELNESIWANIISIDYENGVFTINYHDRIEGEKQGVLIPGKPNEYKFTLKSK